ncbi:MAG TPA: NAD(P)/FAD-dependent oxidoreductase [Terriglobales bacterium]|nr:NAD(P)/FAD-dependent oxidoreductase [Terriglobales bacterium]
MNQKQQPRVVIVGGGFGGLNAANALAKLPVEITLIDRKNYHNFQPLLYQVATAGLSPGEIAAPIRGVLKKYRNVEVLMGEVVGFDLDKRRVLLSDGSIPYDYLVVAAGATHSYFGHEDWQKLAPGLKTIEDAIEVRRRVLLAFELAERSVVLEHEHDLDPIQFVIVGGGPTGVELAGMLSEIARHAIVRDFRSIKPQQTSIILVEGGPRVLPAYPEDLSRSAERQLHKLGVEVRTNSMVTSVEPGRVKIGDSYLRSTVTLWAAGVAASPLGRALGAPLDKSGHVLVNPDLSISGHPEVFVIGDLASLRDKSGELLPGLAPVAMQQGRHAARNISRDLKHQPRGKFEYLDKGTMATIGRAAAIAKIGRLHLTGFIAWFLWLFVHLMYLVGFRNRVLVLLEWAWAYITYQRSARLITGSEVLPGLSEPRGQTVSTSTLQADVKKTKAS